MTNPLQEFKKWLCDGNINSDLDENVTKAVYVVTALVMFSRLNSSTIYLNELYNNEDIYSKIIYENKIEFFKELKRFAIKHKLSIYDFPYINLKKEKIQYEEVQNLFPLLKHYEIEYLIDELKKEKNTAMLDVILDKKMTKRKLSKADIKEFK